MFTFYIAKTLLLTIHLYCNVEELLYIFWEKIWGFKKHQFDFKLYSNYFLINLVETRQRVQQELLDLHSFDISKKKYKKSDLNKFYKNLLYTAAAYESLFLLNLYV